MRSLRNREQPTARPTNQSSDEPTNQAKVGVAGQVNYTDKTMPTTTGRYKGVPVCANHKYLASWSKQITRKQQRALLVVTGNFLALHSFVCPRLLSPLQNNAFMRHNSTACTLSGEAKGSGLPSGPSGAHRHPLRPRTTAHNNTTKLLAGLNNKLERAGALSPATTTRALTHEAAGEQRTSRERLAQTPLRCIDATAAAGAVVSAAGVMAI